MTQKEVIKYGLDLCKQEVGIDGSIFIPKIINTAYINAKIDFESRTCDNCSSRKFNGEFENDVCENMNSLMSEHEVSGDFGCNKWEQR